MSSFICFVFPALISYSWLMKIENEESSIRTALQYVPLLCLMITILNCLVLMFVFHHNSLLLDQSAFTVSFMLRYLAMSLIWVILLPIAISFLKKNLSIKIKMKRNEMRNNETPE